LSLNNLIAKQDITGYNLRKFRHQGGKMHCPACRKIIDQAVEKCGSCGYVFNKDMRAKLELFFEIRKEAEQVKALIKTPLWEGIKRVSDKLVQLEALLEKDLSAEPLSGWSEPDRSIPEPESAEQPQEVFAAASVPEPTAAVKRTTIPASKPPTGQFEVNFGQKWLLIIGLVTMVFGVGYFLKYSFEQGWIGPAGRVSMAYVWGIIFLTAGNHFRKKDYESFGLYLVGGGIATLYFSTFAAFQLYGLIGQVPSFAIMVLITVLAATLAIVYDNKWLAVLGIVGGFLTPVMLSTGQDNQIVLMSYVTILNLGLLAIAFYKKWDLLSIFGFFFTYLLHAAWFSRHYANSKFWPAIIFLNLFYLIYSVMPFAYQFVRKQTDKMEGFIIILPNSLIAFGYSYYMITEYASLQWVSVITITYAVIFLVMASYLSQTGRQEQDAFVVLLAKAALFLVITIPVIFSKHWITIFWAAQAVVLVWMGLRLNRRAVVTGAYLLIALTSVKFFYYDYEAVFQISFLNAYRSLPYTHMIAERLLTSVMVLASLFLFGHMTAQGSLSILAGRDGKDANVFFMFFGIALFIVLNTETSLFFREYLPAASFAALSVLWTVFSVALMLLGFKANHSGLRKASFGLFAVTLVKVFLFDMSNISTPYRIISFIILGLVLVGTSYLYYKFKDKIQSAMNVDRD